MDDGARIRVRFRLGGEIGLTSEGMWAERTPLGTYQLENIPFFAYGVSYQDEVVTRRRSDGRIWMQDIVEDSGNITLRAAATAQDRSIADMHVRELSDELNDIGIGHEGTGTHHLLAINVSEIDDVRGLVGLLGRFELRGRGIWEEAKLMPWWPSIGR